MAEDAHSLFSASGADAWNVCPGKPALETGRKTSSVYADEGTAAHELGKWVLSARVKGFDHTAERWRGHVIPVERWDARLRKKVKRTFEVDDEMVEHVDAYVDRCMLMAAREGADLGVEERVYYHEHLGVPRELAFGTADFRAILFNQPALVWEDADGKRYHFPPGDELQVHDLKYGKGVLVSADGMQTVLYGAGSYDEWSHIAEFSRVRLVIHQPRKNHVDEIVITPLEMIRRARSLRPAVPRVIEAAELAKAMRAEGLSDLEVGERLDARGFLQVSEKGCRFCDAKDVCPAAIRDVTEAVSGRTVRPEDFDDLTVDTREEVREYGANYLQAAFSKLELIEGWMKAVRAEIDHRVLNRGEKFDGLKVVGGKKGQRKFTSQAEAEAFARARPAPIKALMYDQPKLKSPAQLEKALKNVPATWAAMQKIITQEEGKPSVVPASDSRRAISHKALAETFDDLDATEPQQPAPRGVGAGRDRHPFR